MDALPQELVSMILQWNIRMCRMDKNAVLPLRFVCRSFDTALKPYLFKTIQLEFSRLLRVKKGTVSLDEISKIAHLASAIYIDMMVVRDEDEISRLDEVFLGITHKIPEMSQLIQSLRKYCLNDHTFEGGDFRRVVSRVLNATPNATRLKLNLPFQVVGRASATSTLLLANAFACIASREEELPRIETLVLDHISDKTVNDIFNNHMDVSNAFKTFQSLKHLVVSLKRQETNVFRQGAFCQSFWLLIKKASFLESLCLIGWNIKRDTATRRHSPSELSRDEWNMRSLPYCAHMGSTGLQTPLTPGLRHLQSLELKRVDIPPICFLRLIAENCHSLKELYLNEVYLKVHAALSTTARPTALWIGHVKSPMTDESPWIAHQLRAMDGLHLDILRATSLGYDDMNGVREPTVSNYDLDDPTSRKRSFDERFVTAVMGQDKLYSWLCNEALKISYPFHTVSPSMLTNNTPSFVLPLPGSPLRTDQYDAETFQRHHNSTSQFKRCIDGVFFNHSEEALRELQTIIEVADRGMNLITAEIQTGVASLDDTDGIMGLAGGS